MLTDELKQAIQSYYSQLLENRGLRARYGQRLMIAEIARLLTEAESGNEEAQDPATVGVVEAGTGTGKTIAYMVPAIPVARALGKKVVVATATVALQEQVMYRDIPDLLRYSDMRFSYALAKGRGRYLCLAKLDNLLRTGGSHQAMLDLYGMEMPGGDREDGVLYQRMLDALSDGSWQGDRDDWPEALDDDRWRSVAVEHGQCAGPRCGHFSNCCFFKSRDSLEKADCIVANHDLVLSDLALGGGVILPDPAETIYIFDEGHHLPLKGITHFSHTLRLRGTGHWLEQSVTVFNRLARDLGAGGSVREQVEKAEQASVRARAALNEHFPLFEQFADSARGGGQGQGSRVYTFEGGDIGQRLPEPCRALRLAFAELVKPLERILDMLKEAMENEGTELDRQVAEGWFPVVGGMHARASAAEQLWYHFILEDREGEPPHARWLTFTGTDGEAEITVSCSPVTAADILQRSLFGEAFAVLLTSATLSALDRFDFLRMRTGLPESTRYTRIASPFDYRSAVRLRIPGSGFDPADTEAHTRAIVNILPEILVRDSGALVLFSSRRQMQDVLAELEAGLSGRVLCQDDYSKQALMHRHRERVDAGEGSIIFGLAGLAEGIDLPGDYCTHVVIAKLPFAVPNEPVGATLAHWVEREGGNAFQDISVPEAAMRLVQGCGRLLRSESDAGTITVLDERLVTRRYGRAILESLPPYTREIFDPGTGETEGKKAG